MARTVAVEGGEARTRSVRGRRLIELALVAAMFVVATAIRVPTLSQPLIEAHGFRQTQTAYTAMTFHTDGVDLLRSPLPVLGPPFDVPMEFPLFQALAAVPMAWGLQADVAVRTTSLAFFLLTAGLLWGLVRQVQGRAAAAATLLFFLFSPLAILWSRASLMEYLATAGAVGFVWAGIRWREGRSPRFAALALIAFLVGMLVKPTTAAFYVMPLVLYRAESEPVGWRGWFRHRLDVVLIAVILIPVVAAGIWTRYADAVKELTPTTAFLSSSAIATWNFGTLDQRLDGSQWIVIVRRVTSILVGLPGMLLTPMIVLLRRTRSFQFWLGMMLAALLPVLTFFNLFVVHDYYLAAISPAVAGVTGAAVGAVWARLPSRPLSRVVTVSAVAFALVVLLLQGRTYWALAYAERDVAAYLPALDEVRELTSPRDLIVVDGYDWSPELFYYARRRGLMLSPLMATREIVTSLPEQGYRFLVSANLSPAPRAGVTGVSWTTDPDLTIDLIRSFEWHSVLGQHLHGLGQTQQQVSDAVFQATDDPDLVAPPRSATIAERLLIRCDQPPVKVPRGDTGTWLKVARGYDRDALVSLDAAYGRIPVRRHIIAPTSGTRAPLQVSCSGAESIRIELVSDSLPEGFN